jgi:Tfp pilus assembly protein PilF
MPDIKNKEKIGLILNKILKKTVFLIVFSFFLFFFQPLESHGRIQKSAPTPKTDGVSTPQDWFLEAYFITREADGLLSSKNYIEAEKKYRIAYSLLGSLRATYPEWETAIVRYRTKYVKEKLEHLSRLNAQNTTEKKKFLEDFEQNNNLSLLVNPQPSVSLEELQALKNKIANLSKQLELLRKEKEALLENLPYNQPKSRTETFKTESTTNQAFQGMTLQELSHLPQIKDQQRNRKSLTYQLEKALEEAKKTAQQLKEENSLLKKELQDVQSSLHNQKEISQKPNETGQLAILQRENMVLKKTLGQLLDKQKRIEEEKEALALELEKANKLLAFIGEKEEVLAERLPPRVTKESMTALKQKRQLEPAAQGLAFRKESVVEEMRNLFDQGARLYSEKRYKEAYELYHKVLSLDPSNGIGWLNLGLVALAMEKNSEASLFLKKAVEFLPRDPMPYALLGQLYFQNGSLAAATETVEKAVKLDPQNAKLRRELGEIYKARGLELLAAKELNKAIELNPYDGMAHFDLALVYISYNPPLIAQAKRHYRDALLLGVPKDERLEQKIGYSTQR